jgi:thioredoxin reductase (NADPH)
VVGGGDSAVEEAIFLTKFARRVTIIHRRDTLRAAKSIQEKAFANEKISFLWNTVVEKADGEDVLDTLYLKNTVSGEQTVLRADPEDGMLGLFGFIGMLPDTEIYRETGLRLKDGYIDAGEDTHTSIQGVFAAGDIRVKLLRQVVTACADGAVAATEAEKYLSR